MVNILFLVRWLGQDVVDAIEQGDEIKAVKIVRQGEAAGAFK